MVSKRSQSAAALKPMTTKSELPGDLLDVPESARYTHLQRSTIRSWILNRRLPHVKLGRRVFLRRQDLDRLIAKSFVPALEDV